MINLTELQNARLNWQADGAPYSSDYEDVYFSREGGLAETHYVFLQGNDLVTRWQTLDAQLLAEDAHGVFVIGELGFGTGLNFLSCWRLWQQTACQRLRLHFISCEKHPLTHASLQQALQQWPELAEWREPLLAQYPDHTVGYHRLLFSGVTLDLYYGDALAQLRQQFSSTTGTVDAWFLDGFTPAHNPALWSEEVLQTLTVLSRSGATLSSYSVTGRVVRTLRTLGWQVQKRKGFGRKRQMLFAALPADATSHLSDMQSTGSPVVASTIDTDYDQLSVKTKHTAAPKHVAVIGAGLAGCTVARALAERGVRVTVVEAGEDVATRASGNRQAVVQLRLNRQVDTHYALHLHSYLFALRYYQTLAERSNNALHWHPCGVLTLNSAYTHTRKAAGADDYTHYPTSVLQYLSATDVNCLTNLSLNEDGIWLPGGGWMSPADCCRTLLDHPLISVTCNTTVAQLHRDKERWLLQGDKGETVLSVEQVVISNSYAARNLSQTALYPVTPLRGQVSHVESNTTSHSLPLVLCSERYIAPAHEGQHCIGASYVKQAEDTELSVEEHEENLHKLGSIGSKLGLSSRSPLRGRASLRGSSGDFIPLAGQVPDPDLPEHQYGSSRHLTESPAESRLPGLWMSTGHGSHGSVSCPLLAEHLAALICAEPSPLPQPLADAVDPMRFIRRLRKRRLSAYGTDSGGSRTGTT